jgi:hypothetical protein
LVRAKNRNSRWVSLLATISLLLAGCAAATTAGSPRVTPAGQLGGAFTAASVPSVEHILAADGIATVTDEKSSSPLVPVTGAVRVTFTEPQVRAMALQAADGNGITGSVLNDSMKLPTDYPPFAYLLAAWISTSGTPAAKEILSVMGTQKWSDAPHLVFPTIALPLFAADVIAASPVPSPAPSSSGLTDGAPVSGTGVGSGVTEASFVHSGILDAPCSTVSNFIQSVLSSVFSALQVGTSSSDGAVGGFFKSIWNGAVSLAGAAIQGLVKVITGTVLNAIKSVAGTAVVIAQVVSYLKPWSVKVSVDPSSVNAGAGGTFTAAVDTGTGDLSYPPAITDCASSSGLNLTLPALTAADASGTWALSGPITTSDSTSVTMDSHGKSSLAFTSSKDDSSACGADAAADQAGVAKITVTRPGVESLKDLATSMLTNGLGLAGSIVGPILTSILDPILDSVLSNLSALTDVIGAGTVTIAGATGANCPGSETTTKANPPTSDNPSKTKKVAFVCPSVALVRSVLNDQDLDTPFFLENNPGVFTACVYPPTDSCPPGDGGANCAAEVTFVGDSTDGPSNFNSTYTLLPAAGCDCDVAATSADDSRPFMNSGTDYGIIVLGVLNGVQVGVSYEKTEGTGPGLALLREIFSK